MSNSLRRILLLLFRTLAIAFLALDPALTLAGLRQQNPYFPLWFTCAWTVAAIIALALAQDEGGRLVVHYVPPASQLLIAAAILIAALPDIPRRVPFAIFVGALYWDGLARVWSWVARAAERRA